LASTLQPETEEPSPPRLRRLRAAYERIPPSARLPLGLLALFLFAFSSTVLPLFLLKSTERAEIAGMQSSTGVVGKATTIDLGIDNVGDTLISPICLSAPFDLQVQVQTVTFQGLDTVPFKDGRACGGALSGQETISVQMTLVPQQAGTVHVRLVASKNDKEIGPAVERTMEVSSR
jgi:hypothetical protein